MKKISVKIDHLPENIRPGDKPVTLTNDLLQKLFPELEKPRLMNFTDIGDADEQVGFLEEGYSFVLRGDFNNDKFADIAFVGKYNETSDPEKDTFIAIISIYGKKVVREYFSKLGYNKACLLKVTDYKHNIEKIEIIYLIDSDYCADLFWHKNSYRFEPCRSTH